jgi:23S rRNA (uracil1939-C5)-methyltransferase
MNLSQRLTIERLGARGEGVARGPDGPIYVPYALAGESVIASVDGERGRLAEIVTPSPDRVAPFCPHYGVCGGCAVQALAPAPYAAWKRNLVVAALANAGVAAEVGPLVDAHGEGRRRATLHARVDPRGRIELGFMRARAHAIVEIDHCPLFAPGLAGACDAARAVAHALRGLARPLDIVVTATRGGLDLDLRGAGALDFPLQQKLVDLARTLDLARVANHGATIIERRAPLLRMGAAEVAPPPGAFLQATAAGEAALADLAMAAVPSARRVADLFAGVGKFALRLGARADVHAVESDAAALAALSKAARFAPGMRAVSTERRDLFRRPLTAQEADVFDAVVFDPPRAGAEAQARELAKSTVATLVAVSCDPQTLARDLGVLTRGGYALESVTPVDQFRYSPHVETVAVLRRPAAPGRRKRKLLG